MFGVFLLASEATSSFSKKLWRFTNGDFRCAFSDSTKPKRASWPQDPTSLALRHLLSTVRSAVLLDPEGPLGLVLGFFSKPLGRFNL